MNQLSQNDLELHVKILGWLNVIGGVALILFGVLMALFLPAMGVVSEDQDAIAVLTIVGLAVGCFMVMISLLGLVTGIGLLRRKPWARVLALVGAVLKLFNVPIGTAIGAYTFWVLMQAEATPFFADSKYS